MQTADVNHDGKPDVVLLQVDDDVTSARSLITLLGNGDGTFRAPVKTSIATNAVRIALGDVDGDGRIDLVLAGEEPTIDTYHGNGDGSFTLLASQPTKLWLDARFLLSDLNGDGKLDLIGAIYGSGNFETPLITLRGNGDGTFAPGVIQPGPYVSWMEDITIGDFNGDGRVDVIESSYNDQRIAFGNGDGTFNSPTTILIYGSRTAIAGDFNGDGKLDYIGLLDRGLVASVHLGNGNGAFTSGGTFSTGETGQGVAVDIDGDGRLDLVTGGNDTVSVLLGKGDGTFIPRHYVGNTAALVVADFDGDHHPDVLTAFDPALILLHGNGDGTLRAYKKAFFESNPSSNFGPITYARGLASADFNGDGKKDVVTANDGIIVLLNSGDGGFGPPHPLTIPDGVTSISTFAVGDVNGDGKADIVVIGSRLWTYLGKGDGTFTAAAPTDIPPYFQVFLADVNGDGKPDALLSRWDQSGQLLLGHGDGTFAAPVPLPASPAQIADFNGDGRPDFASNDVTDGYTIYLNNGNGGFNAGDHVRNTVGVLAAGDFDGDGKIDLVEQQYNARVRTRLGKGDGTFTDLPSFLVYGLEPGAFVEDAVVADFDADGRLDLAFSNHVMLGYGDGTFHTVVPCLGSRPWPVVAAADIDGNGSADLLLLDDQNRAVNALLTRTAAIGTTPLSLSLSLALTHTALHPLERVTLTTTAVTQSAFLPSGGVSITSDGVFSGFAVWKDNLAVLPDWQAPSIGDHTIVASFIGDDVFPATSVSVTRTAVQIEPDVNLSVSGFRTSSQQGEPVTIYVTIFPKDSAGGPIPTGTVTIRDGDTLLVSSPINVRQYPILNNYRFLTRGTHTLTCQYSGDTNYKLGTGTLSYLVTKDVVYVGLYVSPESPLIAGQSLTLQASVSAYLNPTGGTVTFRDNGAVIGTATAIGNFASITIQPPAGKHSYTATYNGNADLDPTPANFSRDYLVLPAGCNTPDCGRRRAVQPPVNHP